MPAAVSHHRALLLTASAVLYPLIFSAFLMLEKPGLGLGHFYYIAIALAAMAAGPRLGAIAGFVAAALYATGVVANPHIASAEVLRVGTGRR